jgi:heme exporter protein A
MEKPLLTCINLTHSIGYKQIFKNLNFELSTGERILLTGENGIGKSTLLKLILNFKKRKEFKFDSINPPSISYLGHEAGLYSSLTLTENLDYFTAISSNNIDIEFKNYLLEVFKLNKRIHDPIFTFSEGMKRKTGLIRALLMKSKIILLDEPLNGLDKDSCLLFSEVLKTKLDKQITIVMVSHNLFNFDFTFTHEYKIESRLLDIKIVS